MKMKIGFFDSGIGGLTVLYDTIKILPKEDYIYYADTVNVPYGPKSKDEVKQYILNAVEFIAKQQVKAIVIACNTATSVAIEDLRERFTIPIIGMEPAVKPAVDNYRNRDKRVLVTATALTLKEEKLQNLISRLDNDHVVDLLPLPGLVQYSENLEFREQIVRPYLEEQLAQYDVNCYESVVLGCTHFSYYRDIFHELFPASTNIIDGNIGTANNLKRMLETRNMINEGSGNITFYNSGVKISNMETGRYDYLFKRLEEIEQKLSFLVMT